MKWHVAQYKTDKTLCIVDADNKAVAELWRRNDDEKEFAMANLMAAAPDLYWALYLVKQMLAVNEINLPHTIAVVNEAIAKAKGEA